MVLRNGHCKLRASACHPSRSVGRGPAFGRYRGADLILPISGFAAGPRNLACGHRGKVTGDVACMLSSLFAAFRRRGQLLYKGTKIMGTVFTIGLLFGGVYSSASKFFIILRLVMEPVSDVVWQMKRDRTIRILCGFQCIYDFRFGRPLAGVSFRNGRITVRRADCRTGPERQRF